MKLTKKNDDIYHEEGSLPVLEAEIIDEDLIQETKPDIIQNREVIPFAHALGRIVAGVGPFILGFLQNKKFFETRLGHGNRCKQGRFREKRRANKG
jgi:hypothetical protein